MINKTRTFICSPWVQGFVLHGAVLVLGVLMYAHLSHLYNVQAIRVAADAVDVALTKIESSQRGYLLTGRDVYLGNYKHYVSLLRSRLDALCRLIPANPKNTMICHDLNREVTYKLAEMQSTIDAANAGHPETSLMIVRSDSGFSLMVDIEAQLDLIRIETIKPSKHELGCLSVR